MSDDRNGEGTAAPCDNGDGTRISDDNKEGTPPPHDQLDSLLAQWHEENRAAAESTRRAFAERMSREGLGAGGGGMQLHPSKWSRLAAAAILLLATIAGFLMMVQQPQVAVACEVVMIPDGGRLEAFDRDGNALGPCPLKHTDVIADVSGPFARVRVRQQYTNTHPQKVEAVYTFPLSHRGAVDAMTMTVRSQEGERVLVGEVKERELARQMYEAARESGYVASLLEQERPNIFTQSVANIEPGASVEVEISYAETIMPKDGLYTFDFPTVVGPRYIPGNAPSCERAGLVLLGPAAVEPPVPGIENAVPVGNPAASTLSGEPVQLLVKYGNGSSEMGSIYADGRGEVNGRWFRCPPRQCGTAAPNPGAGFAQGTNQVPDAVRITPMPVPPSMRSGHDISITVNIDTGGPALRDVSSALHKVKEGGSVSPTRRTVMLDAGTEIPNRDFVLTWRVADDVINEGFFATAKPLFMSGGVAARVKDESLGSTDDASTWVDTDGYFTLTLTPPARVEVTEAIARELVFVLDTSGSMRGFPIEKAKETMSKAIARMRPQDTFNVITFSGDTRILWRECRAASEENIAIAQAFLGEQRGAGGTEMMQAILAALQQVPGRGMSVLALADLPADDREVTVEVPFCAVEQDGSGAVQLRVHDALAIPLGLTMDLPTVLRPEGVSLIIRGRFSTYSGIRRLIVSEISFAAQNPPSSTARNPLRVCVFMTDGYVGNDQAIIQAVADNARSTRVFSYGIGNSVNRNLLDGMARAGRGTVEYVFLDSDAGAAVDRLTRRIETPVLTDITVAFEGLEVRQAAPALDNIPDLFDVEPLILHGRYARSGKGAVVVRGRTATGTWERRVEIDAPPLEDEHSVVRSLWARATVDTMLVGNMDQVQAGACPPDLKSSVVALGEKYSIMTPFTSFVAVEKARVTVGGKAVLVTVPIELPQGTSWEGFFGSLQIEPTDKQNARWFEARSHTDSSVGEALTLEFDRRGIVATPSSPPAASAAIGSALRRSPPLDAPAHRKREIQIEASEPPIQRMYDIRRAVGLGVVAAGVAEMNALAFVTELQSAVGKHRWTDHGGSEATWTGRAGLLMIVASPNLQRKIEAEVAKLCAASENRSSVPSGDRFLEPVDLDELWARLDARLLMLSLLGKEPKPPLDEDTFGILVRVRVTKLSDEARDRLRLSGLVVEGESPVVRMLVGRIRRELLDDVALTDGVERISPLEPKDITAVQ